LQQLFGLTPAEVKVAIRLVAGRSVHDIADELDISHRTVRWHINALLEKTDAKSMADLTRLLCRLPERDESPHPDRDRPTQTE
jgi:DNA-binding NarL/FixJ family response regulator